MAAPIPAPPQARPAAKAPAVTTPAGQRPPYWQENRERQAAKNNNTPSGILTGLTATPASQLGTAFTQATANSATALNKQKDEATKQLPVVEESSGSAYAQSQAATARFRARNRMATVRTPSPANPGNQSPVFTLPDIPQQATIVSPNINFRSAGNAAEVDPQRAQQALDGVELDMSDIPTTAEAPVLELDGEANPHQLTTGQQEQGQEVNDAKNEAALEINNDFGENGVIKRPGHHKLKASHTIKSKLPKAKPVAQGKSPTGQTQITLNAQFAPVIQEKLGAESARYDAGQVDYEAKSAEERQKADGNIDAERRKSQRDQLSAQTDVQGQVSQSRQDWQTELNTVETNFNTNANAEASRQNRQIQTKQTEGNTEAQRHITEGNREAETKRNEAQEEGRQKQESSKRESKGFFGWLGDKVSSLISALKSALNFIFDKLRAAVKWIFDKVKRLALAALELARKAIVGLIKAFGEFLKGLVDIAFAAFPGIRDRIKAKIDGAVQRAEAAVNAAFEVFKKVVSAIIDALAAVVDSVLGALQALYNFILDAVEFLVKGLLQILAFIANLLEGAWNSPDQFLGSLAEESLGGNPAAPLHDVEVAEGQEQAWAAAMGRTSGATADGPTAEIPAGDQQLLTKPVLSDHEVTIEPNPPVVLDPALIQNLPPISDGGTIDLGGAPNPVTTQQLQQSAAEENGYELSTPPGQAATSAAGPPAAAPDPNWVQMSDDQKLDHHLNTMLAPAREAGQSEPSPDREHPQPSPDNSPEALITRTGRLSVGKRLSFMGRQMLTGLQVFWQRYKAWIIGGLVAGLLAAGLIAFFTGGAGLVLVIQAIGEILTVVFGAYAIYRAMGEFGKYVKSAWSGDVRAAGKALAMSLAIIVTEFFLDKILAGMGKVFKRTLSATKTALMGTRIGKALARGAAMVRRVQSRAGGLVRRGLTSLRNSRFVIRMEQLIGRGLRRLEDLRESILRRFGFKRIWLEKHGHWLQLWGEFNAKVMLARTDAETNTTTYHIEDRVNPGKVGSKTPDGGIIIDDVGNRFSRNVETISGDQAKLGETFQHIDNATEAERLRKIQTGNPHQSTRADWDMHEKAVGNNLATSHSGQATATQITLDIYDQNGNLVTTIRADYGAMKPNRQLTLIDAKHQANAEVARGLIKPLDTVTSNQHIGYQLIKDGNAGEIIARGAGAEKLGIAGRKVNINPVIEIHTNDVNGAIVKMDLNGTRIP